MSAPIKLSDSVWFASSEDMMIESLFSSSAATASGTYKVRRKGIMFYDGSGAPRAYLCANSSTPFFVTCSQVIGSNGKKQVRYMNALCSRDEKLLGMYGMSFMEERNLAERIWNQHKR